jgi:hypothetical protein
MKRILPRRLSPDRLDDAVIGVEKYAPVVADPRKKIPSSAGLLRDTIGRRQALGVLLQALDAKELGADRFFDLRRSGDRGVGAPHFRSRSDGSKILSSPGLMTMACGSEGTPGT